MLATPPGPVQVSMRFRENCNGSIVAAPSVAFVPSHPSDATQLVAFCESHVTATDPPMGAALGKIDMLTETGGAHESNTGVEVPVAPVEVLIESVVLAVLLVDDAMNGIETGPNDIAGGGGAAL